MPYPPRGDTLQVSINDHHTLCPKINNFLKEVLEIVALPFYARFCRYIYLGRIGPYAQKYLLGAISRVVVAVDNNWPHILEI